MDLAEAEEFVALATQIRERWPQAKVHKENNCFRITFETYRRPGRLGNGAAELAYSTDLWFLEGSKYRTLEGPPQDTAVEAIEEWLQLKAGQARCDLAELDRLLA